MRPRHLAPTLALAVIVMLAGAPPVQAAFPGEDGLIVFSRRNDIWAVDPGTRDPVRLTTTARAREGLADWNAAGDRIAYTRCRPGELSNCDIWAMDADGSNPTRLTATPDAQETWPSWSPDGTKIAFTSNEADPLQDVWVIDADGSNPIRLTATPGFDAFPEWSPDGSTIAFTSDRAALDDIWAMDADGSNPIRLTTGGSKVDERPDWSPDGSAITFSRNGEIWIMDADGSNETRITSNRRFEFGSVFSPEGTRVAFNREARSGRIGVWVMNLDGTGRERLATGRLDLFPDWQPV